VKPRGKALSYKPPYSGESIRKGDKSENKGLISVDRSNEATLQLTIPRSKPVVYKGFSPPNIYTYDARHRNRGISATAPYSRYYDIGPEGLFVLVSMLSGKIIVTSRMDSDLEAFSHNPAHGSFAPLACQLSALPIM
jgi:hypothetical protein